ncbi:hypothetical protein QYM36_011747 [Artemia franciscana]|uniref:Uncharacterized protein n=1 Tax=Artemia franciscana TaxID=6661 RepID=A0AA88KZ99_ARTSF|nr:hypothetical protein QYM36_011747 [Artemia franciscana]
MDVVDRVVPKLNHKVTKWWNETCTKAKHDLKDLKSNYERLPTFHGYVEYQRKAAEFKKTVIAAKLESWINFLNKLDFRVPALRVYSTVKSLISGSREGQRNPPITYKNSTLVTDQEIAEAAVSLLDSVIGVPDPLSDCEIEGKAKVKRFSKSHRSVAYNQPFLTQEIEKVINHLPLTAPGKDMIFPQFVKALPKNWVAALLNIINEFIHAYNEGKFGDLRVYSLRQVSAPSTFMTIYSHIDGHCAVDAADYENAHQHETSSIFTIYLHSFRRTWTAEGSTRMRYSVQTEKNKAVREKSWNTD